MKLMDSEMKVAPEVAHLVADFFAQALVRDSQGIVTGTRITRKELEWVLFGMKPPTVPADLFELISNWSQHPESVSVLKQVNSQWREHLGAFAQKSEMASYEERVARLAPIDRLKLDACDPQSHPTEATLVAKMYLNGTYDTPRNPKYALRLLVESADHGNAEAAYLLATTKVADVTVKGLRMALAPYLLEDERLRQEYRKQARSAGFKKESKEEEWDRFRDEIDKDKSVAELQQDLEHDHDYVLLTKEFSDILPNAKSGDPEAQLKLALNLLAQVDHLALSYYGLWSKDKTARQQMDNSKAEARNWLLKASHTSAAAQYQLAMRFANSEEDRFVMLNSAAYPTGDVTQYRYALVPLATDFYMNPESSHHNIDKGLICLRQYLHFYESIPFDLDRPYGEYIDDFDPEIIYDEMTSAGLDIGGKQEFIRSNRRIVFGMMEEEDAQAAICLADHAIKHPQDERVEEAYIWYRAVAVNITNAAYAALQAGLMEMRGQGCEKNLDRAKALFDLARKSHSFNPRDARAVKYADALYRLGFELPGHSRLAVDLLLELAEETEFKGDPECCITPADIEFLVVQNPDWEEYLKHRDAFRSDLPLTPRPYCWAPFYPEIVKGLIWAIQAQVAIPRESLSALLDGEQSMLSNYVLARLVLADRLTPPVPQADIEPYLEKIDQLWKDMHREGNSKILDFQEQELADSIWERTRPLVARLEAERAVEEDRLQTISFLSHTLVNATAGGANEVREIAAKLARMQTTVDFANESARLAAETSRMAMVESIVTVFKQYTARPDALTEMWAQDTGGSFSILQVVALSMRQALLRFYFASDHELDFQRLLPDTDYASVAQEFLADVAILDINHLADVHRFFEWLRMRLPFLRLDLDSAELEALHLHQGGARSIVIFALVGEFLANALKYTSKGGSILLSVRPGAGGLSISSSNTLDLTKPTPVLGGKSGLDFVRRVCNMIGADFNTPAVLNGNFSLGATLPIQ